MPSQGIPMSKDAAHSEGARDRWRKVRNIEK